jgi:non-specific serine/threonine protein kinase/serine/threonine-protein kinase
MTAEQWEHVKTLLEATLERPAAEREWWLQTHCPDAAMREEVRSLLRAHLEVEDFLEQPADAGEELVAALRPESLIGERIGPWRLVEEIGRGGMGTVYRAVRADDEFRRVVAIKIVGRGLDTDMLLKRFRTERQILANLEHPYIARLIDGGTTPSGLPYFVMEYVQGVPLTDYCDQHRLNIHERIDLFRKVCSAVAYAHHNLIVHRDLKPANILVTADGTPKLLDFGIARLMSGSGREASEPTVTMLRMATPAYASPEQIRGTVAGMPTDIYSLGVILYELLTGHRPYRLPPKDSGELARVICEREPTRASVVVGFSESIERADGEITIVDAETVCHDRDTTIDQLRRRLRGDLDNILAMALRKEPHRRYESVDHFSQDLHRHVAGLPILARRDTLAYRAGKFIERHRIGVPAGIVVAILLCITTVVALHKASRLAGRVEEDQRLATAFLVDIHDSIARLPGSTPAREAIVQQSLKYLDGLSRDAGQSSTYRRSLALAWEKFAELQIGYIGPGLGRSLDALQTCRKAMAIRESVAKDNPNDLTAQFELANNYTLAGYIAGRAGTADLRLEFDTKALAIAEKLIGKDPRNPGFRAALARAHTSLAYGLIFDSQYEAARVHLNKSLAIYTEIAAEKPSDRRAQRDLAILHYRVGSTYVQTRQPAHAREHLNEALLMQEKLLATDPENNTYLSDIAATHHFLGMALGQLAQHADALRQFDRAIQIRRASLAHDPRDGRTRYMLAGNYSQRAAVQLQSKDLRGALESARMAVQLQESVMALDGRAVPMRVSMAEFQARVGAVLAAIAAEGRRSYWVDAAHSYRDAVVEYNALQAEGYLRGADVRSEAAAAKDALARCEKEAASG